MNKTNWSRRSSFHVDEMEAFDLEDLPIWRYMTITKFINLIADEAIYFCPAEKFEDPYEGCYNKITYESLTRVVTPQLRTPEALKRNQQISSIIENKRKSPVSCWHINPKESEAMWKLYSQDKQGIAIETTSKSLIDSLHISEQHKNFRAGIVTYHDPQETTSNSDPIFVKRQSYSHEKEFRLTFSSANSEGKNLNLVSCDIENMIHNVHISPWSDKLYADAVKYICLQKGLQVTPRKSQLLQGPHWYN